MKKRKSDRRRTLRYVILVLALAAILAVAAIYINFNSTLVAALGNSLNTFRLTEVTYPTVEPDSIDLNISFILRNPSDFAVTVESIIIYFSVDDRDIGGVSISPGQDIPAGESSFFYFIRHVTDDPVLNSVRNQTYRLGVEGRIDVSARFFFVQSVRDRRLVFSERVTGTSF